MDARRVRVYGQILFNVTPENADQVEEDIQLELMGLQDEGGRLPFFLLVFVFNQVTGKLKQYHIRYSYDALKSLLDTVRDPSAAWENYRSGAYDIDSDTKHVMAELSPEEKDGEPIEVYQLAQIGLYHPNFSLDMDQELRELLYTDFPELAHMPRGDRGFTQAVGRFMTYRFDWKVFKEGLSDETMVNNLPLYNECLYWDSVRRREGSENGLSIRYQIPWFLDKVDLSEIDKGAFHIVNEHCKLYEKEEGDKPIEDEIYKTPCMLYALKGQLRTEDWDELSGKDYIHADGVKTYKVRKFLNDRGYQLVIRRIKAGDSRIHPTVHSYPSRKTAKMIPVEVDYWENHWMRHYKDESAFLSHLERAKKHGIIKPFNAFEYYQAYDNYAIDAMIDFDDKAFIKQHPNEYEFTELDYEKAEYKDRFGINHVIFADFEATTDEECHKPFLVCAEEYETKIKDNKMEYTLEGDYYYWGKDCAEAFLHGILQKYGSSDNKKKRPSVRVYFHNLKYDFTFLFPYLSDINEITKGGRLYSAKCCYKSHGKKVYIDFWDSYPVFQMSLKNAVFEYLSEKERSEMNIQKEVFPYGLYTYSFFEKHEKLPKGWKPLEDPYLHMALVEEAKPYFTPEQYEEFLLNLKKSLPFVPHYDDWDQCYGCYIFGYRSKLYDQIDFHDPHSLEYIKTKQEFDYKEYAIFYCKQDVRCLAAIIKKFSNLLLGTGVEGVYGVPPFSMNLMAYRTASSIGFDYFLKTVMFQQNEDKEWVPRHDWAVPKCALRAIIQKTIRGGRVMCRDNKKWHYPEDPKKDTALIYDYDAVSLYPSAMSVLWLTDGIPQLIKGDFTRHNFLEHFAPPEASPEEAKTFLHQDGCIHLTHLNTRKPRHFPLLCIKDPKTKLNNYRNFNDEDVDTWVNAIDLFNLINFQDADFTWDAAVVWNGERHYEIRESIQALFDFRLENHKTIRDENGKELAKHEHPIQKVAKLMMNSIFGKSILKVSNKEKKIVPLWKWRKGKEGTWEKYDNWLEFFKANLYRIHRIDPISETQTEVEIYKRDVSASMNIFGSNVLAMARRIIGRVMALAEDIEEFHPELCPGIFYTDTDSMHIRADLLEKLEVAYKDVYRKEIRGEAMGTFHVDFDPLKGGEKVKGAVDCWFIAKKMYADKLLGVNGGEGYHLRMKGIPSDLIKYEYYEKIFNDEPFTFDLLSNGHISIYHEHGKVCSRTKMTRTVMTKEAREKQIAEKRARSQSDATSKKQSAKKAKRTLLDELNVETSEEDEYLSDEQVLLNPPDVQEYYNSRQKGIPITFVDDEGDTVLLPEEPPSEQDEPIDEDAIVDIE